MEVENGAQSPDTVNPAQEVPVAAPDPATLLRVEVIADGSGKFCGNGLTFSTLKSAEDYATNLMWRWTAVRTWRVVDAAGNVVSTMK